MMCYITFLFFDILAVNKFVSNSEFDVEKVQPTATHGQSSLCCSIIFDGVAMAVLCHYVIVLLKIFLFPYRILVGKGLNNNWFAQHFKSK